MFFRTIEVHILILETIHFCFLFAGFGWSDNFLDLLYIKSAKIIHLANGYQNKAQSNPLDISSSISNVKQDVP